MMWLDSFNRVIEHIEGHLEEETNYERLAGMLGYSAYHFQRLFLMMAGVSVAEYIRSRRLAKAAEELQGGDKALDVAVKYQYSTAASFNRAFKAMHGIPPSEVQRGGATIKAYPPLSYQVTVTPGRAMDYRITELGSFRIVGRKLSTTMEGGECYARLPAFWGELMESGGPGELLALLETEPLGLLGVSDYNPDLDSSRFDYYIAVSTSKPAPAGLCELVVPASAWAAFPHPADSQGEAQRFQQRILFDWLPSSGYEFAKAPDLEVYDADGGMETWIPVTKRKAR